MADFWSMVGLVFKSMFVAGETVDDDSLPIKGLAKPENICLYAIAPFAANDPSGTAALDPFGQWLQKVLSDIPETAAVALDRHIVVNADVADPFLGIREANSGALNQARRQDASAVFWGRNNAEARLLDVHFINDTLNSPLYELLMPLVHSFRQPQHKDTAAAMRVLLVCEMLSQARGHDRRALQIAQLVSHVEDFQERIKNGEYFTDVGQGVATAYALGVVMLAETGERSYCVTAIRVLKPIVRNILKKIGEQPKEAKPEQKATGLLNQRAALPQATGTVTKIEDLLRNVADLALIDPEKSAILALYGTLLNWSMISNMNAGSAKEAIGIWKLLERRFELMAGTPVSRAVAIAKLGEAMMIHAKEIDDIETVEAANGHCRRALALINSRAHTVLYAQTAYGLAETVVAHSTISGISIPSEQVIPVFQAALKVCSRRDNPYLWGRAMFALGSVQFSVGASDKDIKLIGQARMNFSQAYDAFDEAGARGAARAASSSYTRSENIMHQLEQRQSIIDATGGASEAKAS
ncbi:hypothetical protein [Thalassospira alkalitolerans]|uniref:Uncharacterized protein n=1 Tax=Thalassospira alkalitolerans TaxID=1293890 RepID=A0A1Y2LG96_9PROT|nr:hypothetical protein [Thalassospira alkalitolerans]OSQ49955.1 hypothetical protein TALK_00070 [Thalassospira alkalitolerans]